MLAPALASSACWGTADFFAGLKSASTPAAAVVAWSQGMALLVISVVVAVRHDDFAAEGWPLWSVAAASAGTVGLVCFYAALSTGTMGVVAPIASLGVVVPVLLGLLGGEQPPALAWVGMAIAVVGVLLASGPELSGDVSPRLSAWRPWRPGVRYGALLPRPRRSRVVAAHSGECG